VELTTLPEDKKLEVIQLLREANGRSLSECARMVETLPCTALETPDVNAARELHRKLRELGAKASFSQTHSSVYRFR
jgi:ribosomal protein L7/L12